MGADMNMPFNAKFVPQLKAAKMVVGGKSISVYDRVMSLDATMKKGESFDPFTGPIKDRNGVLRVPAGKTMSVGDLNSMAWVVPGVVGQGGRRAEEVKQVRRKERRGLRLRRFLLAHPAYSASVTFSSQTVSPA